METLGDYTEASTGNGSDVSSESLDETAIWVHNYTKENKEDLDLTLPLAISIPTVCALLMVVGMMLYMLQKHCRSQAHTARRHKKRTTLEPEPHFSDNLLPSQRPETARAGSSSKSDQSSSSGLLRQTPSRTDRLDTVPLYAASVFSRSSTPGTTSSPSSDSRSSVRILRRGKNDNPLYVVLKGSETQPYSPLTHSSSEKSESSEAQSRSPSQNNDQCQENSLIESKSLSQSVTHNSSEKSESSQGQGRSQSQNNDQCQENSLIQSKSLSQSEENSQGSKMSQNALLPGSEEKSVSYFEKTMGERTDG